MGACRPGMDACDTRAVLVPAGSRGQTAMPIRPGILSPPRTFDSRDLPPPVVADTDEADGLLEEAVPRFPPVPPPILATGKLDGR